MMIGSVLGVVALDRTVPGAGEKRFVQVRCGDKMLAALDPVGAEAGQRVLLAMGDCAGRLCQDLPVDAVILGIVGNNG